MVNRTSIETTYSQARAQEDMVPAEEDIFAVHMVVATTGCGGGEEHDDDCKR